MTPNLQDDQELIMNEAQFQLALVGSRVVKKNREILHKLLVQGIPRTEVMEQENIPKQRISQLIESVEKNYKRQLEKRGLVVVETIVEKAKVPEVEEIEKVLLTKVFEKD